MNSSCNSMRRCQFRLFFCYNLFTLWYWVSGLCEECYLLNLAVKIALHKHVSYRVCYVAVIASVAVCICCVYVQQRNLKEKFVALLRRFKVSDEVSRVLSHTVVYTLLSCIRCEVLYYVLCEYGIKKSAESH